MKGIKIAYSQKELDYVKLNCQMSIDDLHRCFCETFNRNELSKQNISSLRKRNGWLTGRSGKFKVGQKKIKGSGAKSANKTSFKKGGMPHNHKPVGSERVTKDGYIEVKIKEPKKWRLKHLHLWELINGEVPKGYCLRFIDNNKLNFSMENIELIRRAENMITNTLTRKLGEENKTTVRLIAKIKDKTNQINSGK